MYKRIGKRILDIVISTVFILFFFWLYILLYFLIKQKLGSPVIFKQERPGLHGRIFVMYKYRTMTNQKDEIGNLLPDQDRLTKFGKLLRSTSLDEIPEFFNVLRGEMSLIGPRPLLVSYLKKYTAEQARRHEVRPGISGWAQVNGRNTISWEEKFKYDIEYIDHLNFFLDVKIIFMTVKKIFKRDGISQQGNATMKEFEGDKK